MSTPIESHAEQKKDMVSNHIEEEHPALMKSVGDDDVTRAAIGMYLPTLLFWVVRFKRYRKMLMDLGGTVDDLPKGYYRSSYFLGSTAVCLPSCR